MKTTTLWLGGAVALVLGATGCGGKDAPDAKEVADTAASRSADMARGVSASMRMVSELSAFRSLSDATSLLGDSFSGVPIDGSPGTCTGTACGSSDLPGVGISAPDEATTDEQTARLEKYLRERIFTEDNVEGTDGDSTVFRLTGEDVCTDGSEPANADCVKQVDDAELRVRATRLDDDGLLLTFLIGPDRADPLALRFERDRLALDVDLGGVKAAVQHLDADAAKNLPRVMVGTVELALEQRGEQHFAFTTSVLNTLRVEADVEDVGTYVFTTARAVPLATLEMDGPGKRVGFSLDLGTTEFRAPYTGTASTLSGRQWVVALSGLSYALDASEGQQDFAIAHVGLGNAQSYVALGDDKLVTVDLNALSGRHFDLKLTRGADGLPLVSVTPEFDLVTKFFLAPLKADATETVPSFYEDATYRVRLSGGGTPSFRPVPANTATGFPGGLKVVSGALELSSSGTKVAVPAGQCLVGRDTAAEGSHPLLGHLEARECP